MWRQVRHHPVRSLSRCFRTTPIQQMPVIPFKLADIGEGIAEVEVMQWFVKEGDKISQFQNVCEVQSDKATVEITSRFDGVVTKLNFEVGDMAPVGSTLIDLDVDDATAAANSSKSSSDEPAPTTTTTPEAPPKVDSAPPVAVTVPEPSHPSVATATNNVPPVRKEANSAEKVQTTPSVRRLAKEHGIDLTTINGTGPNGRILKGDLLDVVKFNAQDQSNTTSISNNADDDSNVQVAEAVSAPSYLTQDQVIPIRGMQRMMVKSMNAALKIPHFGYNDEVRMDAINNLRIQLKPLAAERNVSNSYMPFIIKAASLALRSYPQLNATLSDDEATLTHLAEHHISVAMDTPRGLVVPNIKSVQHKSIFEIAAELTRLSSLGMASKLGEADLTGGTFSISNIGNIGGTYLSPVIMTPQVAIGAVGSIRTLPRYNHEEELEAHKIMNVSWSGDHRVIDGATMARFSNLWKSYLEEPLTMLTELK